MRIVTCFAAAAAALVTALPAAAQDAAEAPAPQQRARDGDGDRMVCVRMQLSGSRLVRRVCRTEREWEERASLDGLR